MRRALAALLAALLLAACAPVPSDVADRIDDDLDTPIDGDGDIDRTRRETTTIGAFLPRGEGGVAEAPYYMLLIAGTRQRAQPRLEAVLAAICTYGAPADPPGTPQAIASSRARLIVPVVRAPLREDDAVGEPRVVFESISYDFDRAGWWMAALNASAAGGSEIAEAGLDGGTLGLLAGTARAFALAGGTSGLLTDLDGGARGALLAEALADDALVFSDLSRLDPEVLAAAVQRLMNYADRRYIEDNADYFTWMARIAVLADVGRIFMRLTGAGEALAGEPLGPVPAPRLCETG